MFNDLIKTLDNLNSISVPIEADEKGYIDRQCPSEECEFIFKVIDEETLSIFVPMTINGLEYGKLRI